VCVYSWWYSDLLTLFEVGFENVLSSICRLVKRNHFYGFIIYLITITKGDRSNFKVKYDFSQISCFCISIYRRYQYDYNTSSFLSIYNLNWGKYTVYHRTALKKLRFKFKKNYIRGTNSFENLLYLFKTNLMDNK